MIILFLVTGVGIEPQVLAQLLNINVHQSTRGTAEEQGTGLGLIICKEMVERNGGHIWLESEVGKGAFYDPDQQGLGMAFRIYTHF